MRTRIVRTAAAAAAAALAGLAACARHEGPSGTPGQPAIDGSRTSGGITYRAETLVLESYPVQLRTIVTATNGTAAPVKLHTGGCEAFIRAYRTADRSGTPAWDQRYAVACTKILKTFDFGPGQSVKLTMGTTARDILGDSLPNGRYYLSVVPATDESVVVPAGDVQLDVPR